MTGRQILDAVFIAIECIHSRFSEGLPGLVCKLDFENAFDKVDWSFILSAEEDGLWYKMDELDFEMCAIG